MYRHALRFWSKMNLNKKAQTIFLGIIAGYLMLLCAGLFYLEHYITNYSLEKDEKLLATSINTLNVDIAGINDMSRMLITNDEAREYLKSTSVNTNERRAVQEELYKLLYIKDYISSIFLIREDGEWISGFGNEGIIYVDEEVLYSAAWTDTLDEELGKAVISYNGAGAFRAKSGKPLLSYRRAFYDIDTQKNIGYLVINLNEEFWKELFHSQTEETAYASQWIRIEDLDGNCYLEDDMDPRLAAEITAEKENVRKRITYGGKSFNLIRCTVEKWDLSVTMINQDAGEWSSFLGLAVMFVLFLMFSMMALFVINHFMSISIIRPIGKLIQSMEYVQEGWMKRVSMRTNPDEIGKLKDSYNEMLVQINKLMEELVEKESEKYRLELNLLQEQVNPHFLYNTLYSIEYTALKHGDQEVYGSLQTLGDFYRNFLSKGSTEITILQEVQMVTNYLKLQSLRFSDMFTWQVYVEDGLEQYSVLRLILQPLVENSIYHGIQPKGETCEISIRITKRGDWVYLSVKDTGIGMTAERLKEVLQKDNKKNFGLKSTMERIELYYKTEDIYEIHSEAGEFTEIVIKIPEKRMKTNGQNH